MSALIVAAALAAQAAGSTGSAAPTDQKGAGPHPGITSYLDLEAGAGYSSNSNLSLQDNRSSAYGRIALHAVHTRYSERTSTVLSAFGQNLFYTKHYGSEQSLSVSARHDAQVNEKLRLWGDANASYDKGGQLDTRIINVPGVPFLPERMCRRPFSRPEATF